MDLGALSDILAALRPCCLARVERVGVERSAVRFLAALMLLPILAIAFFELLNLFQTKVFFLAVLAMPILLLFLAI